MKILIVGIARSGTSALYFKLKQALPDTTWCLYEPPRFDSTDPGGLPDVLAKIVIGPADKFDYTSFCGFDRKIMIVRDPRDNLISRLLYHPCATAAFRADRAKIAVFLNTLRCKEADPRSVSVVELMDWFHFLTGLCRREWLTMMYDIALDFHRANDEFVVCKYEDFIAGRNGTIGDYLGISLPPGEAVVAAQYQHVVRTKSAHNWKDWFTPDDVDYFAPYLKPFMAAYGYADDWELAEKPHIDPAHTSEFVRRSVAIRQAQELSHAQAA
jgi:hypothetical protein